MTPRERQLEELLSALVLVVERQHARTKNTIFDLRGIEPEVMRLLQRAKKATERPS